MTPSTAAFRGVWGAVQVVRLVKLRMGRQRGGQACAARPCWRRSRRACLSFNKLHEHLFRGETAFGVGFSAACGSTNINSLQVYPPLSNTGGKLPNYR